jgi:hypothetical protein
VDQLLKLIDRCREDIGDGDKPGPDRRRRALPGKPGH